MSYMRHQRKFTPLQEPNLRASRECPLNGRRSRAIAGDWRAATRATDWLHLAGGVWRALPLGTQVTVVESSHKASLFLNRPN